MKIGLFGGSFNPVHNSHVKIVREVLSTGVVDEVWIIPCYSHNFGKELISFEDRIDMLNLAFSNFDDVKICEIEKKLGGVSRAYDTVTELKKKFSHDFFWVCGSDCVGDFEDWHRAKDLASKIEFVVYDREGFDARINSLMKIALVLDVNADGVSSSEVRERIKNDCCFDDLLPEKVLRHINKMELYRNGVN